MTDTIKKNAKRSKDVFEEMGVDYAVFLDRALYYYNELHACIADFNALDMCGVPDHPEQENPTEQEIAAHHRREETLWKRILKDERVKRDFNIVDYLKRSEGKRYKGRQYLEPAPNLVITYIQRQSSEQGE